MHVSPLFMISETHADAVAGAPEPAPEATVKEAATVHTDDEQEGKAEVARALPDVKEPSPEEVARHCLTHLPYNTWCRW